MKALRIPTPDNRALAVYGGAAALALILLYSIVRAGQPGGQAIGKGVANFAGGLAVGAVKGVGDVLGLPDPADPGTRNEGRLALARGDYFEASKKLPAAEFLSGVFGAVAPARAVGQALGLGPVGPQNAPYYGDSPLDPEAGAAAPAQVERPLSPGEYYGL